MPQAQHPLAKGLVRGATAPVHTPYATVAHNCHGKPKNLTAKTKYLTAKPKTSRQKQNTSLQHQKLHGKNKIPHGKTGFAVRFLVLP